MTFADFQNSPHARLRYLEAADAYEIEGAGGRVNSSIYTGPEYHHAQLGLFGALPTAVIRRSSNGVPPGVMHVTMGLRPAVGSLRFNEARIRSVLYYL